MKYIVKITLAVFVMSLIACTDKKKEAAEVKAAVETIDSLKLDLDELSKEVDTKTKELEDSLEALDSI